VRRHCRDYPSWFLGDWTADSELTSVELPQGEDKASNDALRARAALGTEQARARYSLRFKPYRDKVIQDRVFGVRSWLQDAGGVDTIRTIEQVEWDPTNANVLTSSFSRGDGTLVRREFYVRARAVGVPDGREDDLFNASEQYQEVAIDSRTGAPARVSPRRRVAKYKRVAGPQIQLLQRMEVYPELATPDGATALGIGDSSRPIATYKYRVLLRPAGSA
jgi:hypothetical protein